MKTKSKSQQSAIKILYAALQILVKNGGSMPIRQLTKEIENRVQLTNWEKEVLESTGNIRWQSIMHFTSVDYVKAGYLIKKRGTWSITPEGEDALKFGPDKMHDSARELYVKWYKGKTNDDVSQGSASQDDDNDASKEAIIELETLEEKATEGIREHLKAKNPYEFQDMVAALLRAMGYYTPFIAPKGKDGGVDIIAYVDPLGARTPRVKVQVKHRPDTAIGSPDIRALVGVLRAGDIALFVTSGTFSADAKNTATSSREFIRLIDGDEFIDMWQQYYDKMTDEDKNLLPLKRISFLGNNE